MSVRPRREALPADTHADQPDKRSWRRSEALEGTVVPADIADIKRLEDEYDTVYAQAVADGFTNRWQTAQKYAEAIDGGNSQHEIARLVGKSRPHVGYMARVWHKYGGNQVTNPQSFSRYYQDAKKAIDAIAKKSGAEESAEEAAATFDPGELMACKAGSREVDDPEFIGALTGICRENGWASRTKGSPTAEWRMETAIEKARNLLKQHKAQEREAQKAASNGSVPAGNDPQPGCTCVTCPVHARRPRAEV